MTTATDATAWGAAPEAPPTRARPGRSWAFALGALALLAVVAELTGSEELTTSGTFSAAFRLGAPILLAALGGLWSERVGVVNIGLEGMLILGTWFGAWAAWQYGPWWGILAALLGGAMGGLLHAAATVTFGVDHIVSGVAINILAAGVARFLSVITYTPETGGGATQSPNIGTGIADASLPVLSGGSVFGLRTPDLLGAVERLDWLVISDLAALLRGLTRDVSWLLVIAVALVPLSWWILWRTPLGLRLRSVGENPYAAESLGVAVYRMKYIGVVVSGALAGLGGAILVLEAAGIYREGQTGGRGFIALAAVIFGNWRPVGAALGAGLFGYADALQLRSGAAVHGLLLLIAIVLAAVAVRKVLRRELSHAAPLALAAGAFLWWWSVTETVPRQFVFFTPHIVTLIVLTFAAQHLRVPAADGLQYRKGQAI